MFKKLIFILFGALSTLLCFPQSSKVAHPSPVIAWEVKNLCFGDSTSFINTTTGATYYFWTIHKITSSGDSLTYYTAFPDFKYKFPHKGQYKVELMADNGHQVYLSRILKIESDLHAAFDYQDCNSLFTNLSGCYQTSKWNFGDGSTSTSKNPVHFYTNTGTYNVKLKVCNGSVCDSIEDDINITMLNEFKGTFNHTNLGDSIEFSATDTTSSLFITYHWAFGDGTTKELTGFDKGYKVHHSYPAQDSTYYVFLLIKSLCSFAYSQQVIQIGNGNQQASPSLFPNPVINDNYIFISKSEEIDINSIKILNSLGQNILDFHTIETQNGYKIFFNYLPSGHYAFSFLMNGTVKVIKFIKM